MRGNWLALATAATLAASASFAAGFADVEYESPPVEAKVGWYTVQPNLANVSNRGDLPELSDEQRSALSTYGFVARPTVEEQIFYVYENNDYRNIPTFVTTDSVLHTFHVFYDHTLRHLEESRFLPVLHDLSARLLQAALDARSEAQSPEMQEAVTRAAAYFAVPLTLLGGDPQLPDDIRRLVDRELQLVDAAAGREESLTGTKIDYTQFKPRGHYTRNEALERYFRAMMWYGLLPMAIESDAGTRQALVITELVSVDGEAEEMWRQLYEPITFFVGRSDDLLYHQYVDLAVDVFGEGTLERFSDAARLAEFRRRVVAELPHPGIETEWLENGREVTQGQQFRFMGQRFIPDSRILQMLTYPKVGTQDKPRLMPSGLDVMAVLGSERAALLLDKVYEQAQYANYLDQREKMRAEFAALTPAEWRQNLYYGWLWTLQPLLEPRPEGWPMFTRNVAWRDKSLVTALGSWTELRHDTLLYGKQSSVEAGGDAPPVIPGYVEPEPVVYDRLGWLVRAMRAGLAERGLVEEDGDLAWQFENFSNLLGNLSTISRKQLAQQPLSVDELYSLRYFGSELEGLMVGAASLGQPMQTRWWDIENKTDRHMAIVADVHTAGESVLQEAVGSPAELWVIVPFKDRLIAARGAMFTWYEFEQPSSDRLTDEQWQEAIETGRKPEPASWIQRFLIDPGPTRPISRDELGGWS